METVKADDKAKFGMLGIHFVMYLFYRSFYYTFFVIMILYLVLESGPVLPIAVYSNASMLWPLSENTDFDLMFTCFI